MENNIECPNSNQADLETTRKINIYEHEFFDVLLLQYMSKMSIFIHDGKLQTYRILCDINIKKIVFSSFTISFPRDPEERVKVIARHLFYRGLIGETGNYIIPNQFSEDEVSRQFQIKERVERIKGIIERSILGEINTMDFSQQDVYSYL